MSPARLDGAARAAMVDGLIVLAGLLCVLLIVTGCASAVENSWKPCREQPDATMIFTPDGYVINCLTNPDKAVPRPKERKPFGSVTQ
jgi:hypothetical protein